MRTRESGYTIVEYVVAESGRVVSVKVVESSPGTVYNRVARAAVREWKHEPLPASAGSVRSAPLKIAIYFCFPEDDCDRGATPAGVPEMILDPSEYVR